MPCLVLELATTEEIDALLMGEEGHLEQQVFAPQHCHPTSRDRQIGEEHENKKQNR